VCGQTEEREKERERERLLFTLCVTVVCEIFSIFLCVFSSNTLPLFLSFVVKSKSSHSSSL